MIRTPVPSDERRLQRGENQRIFSQMRRYFAPASVIPPPFATASQTGNRNTVLTQNGSSTVSNPTDSSKIRLIPNTGQFPAGTGAFAYWNFSTQFTNPALVTATPIGALPGGSVTATIRLNGPGTNKSILIRSSDDTDNRFLHVHAVGNPN